MVPFEFSTQIVTDTTLIAKWLPLEHEVTFLVDGEQWGSKGTAKHGGRASQPKTVPSKAGHSFTGWLIPDPETETGAEPVLVPYDFTNPVMGDIALTAGWKAETFQIDFDTQGGDRISPVRVPYRHAAAKPVDPVKDGAIFTGWYTDKRLTTSYDFTSEVEKDVTLYAGWLAAEYVVTFDTKGGSGVSPVTVKHAQRVSLPKLNPTHPDGLVFNGWHVEGTDPGTGKPVLLPYDFMQPVTSDLTVVASWVSPTHVVTFDTNGAGRIGQIEIGHGKTLTEPETLTRIGYSFTGWYIDQKLTHKYDFTTPVKEELKLYAGWRLDTFTVVFDYDGGIDDKKQGSVEVAVPAGGTADPLRHTPVKNGAVFAGWFVKNPDTGELTVYNFAETKITSDLRVVAVWDTAEHLVTFNTGGGSSLSPIEVGHGKLATKPVDPVKDGAIFTGWYTDQKLTQKYDFATPVTAELTLYAKWAVTVHEFTFDYNGGMVGKETFTVVKVGHGKPVLLPEVAPVNPGHTFAGWHVKTGTEGGKEKYVPFNVGAPAKGDLTVVALWKQGGHEIVFHSGGGTLIKPVTVTDGEKLAKPVPPTKPGAIFTGWYTDKTLKTSYDFDTPVTTDLVLYAGWAVTIHQVTFDYAGGTTTDGKEQHAIKIPEGKPVQTPRIYPSKTGKYFAGWMIKNQNGNWEPYNFMTPVTAPVTITAAWTDKSYTVRFHTGKDASKIPTQTVGEGGYPQPVENPDKKGAIFTGWYLDKQLKTSYTWDTPITTNTILYAGWKTQTITHTITYDTQGGSNIPPAQVKHGMQARQPRTNPTKPGKTFHGWYTKNKNGELEPYDYTTPITKNTTITAHWE